MERAVLEDKLKKINQQIALHLAFVRVLHPCLEFLWAIEYDRGQFFRVAPRGAI